MKRILLKIKSWIWTQAFVHLVVGVTNATLCWLTSYPFAFWVNLVAAVFNLGCFINRITPEAK